MLFRELNTILDEEFENCQRDIFQDEELRDEDLQEEPKGRIKINHDNICDIFMQQ